MLAVYAGSSIKMHGLPKDFDGSMFIGRTVEVISFAAYSIVVSFDNNVSITIESSFEHLLPGLSNASGNVQSAARKKL